MKFYKSFIAMLLVLSMTCASFASGTYSNSTAGGTYTTSGTGSPAIYSTAKITASNATLKSNAAQGVVIEGGNS